MVLIGLLFLFVSTAKAQVTVVAGTPPPWGPMEYTEVRYYYLPDVEAYYDVQTSMFIYYGGGVWVRRQYLPSRYRYYDLYSGYKIVINDYRGSSPYVYYRQHRTKYAKGYRGAPQKTIGVRPAKENSKSNVRLEKASSDKPSSKKGKIVKGSSDNSVKHAPNAQQNGNQEKGKQVKSRK